MVWDKTKENLLASLAERIDSRGAAGHGDALHQLSQIFFSRFPAADLRGRSVENVYGLLYGLLRFMNKWPERTPKVRIFNPEIQSHGWESNYTVVAILCRDMPFCTASVRGELNRRNIRIHSIASCNLVSQRADDGELVAIFPPEKEEVDGHSKESLVFFEIGRFSNLDQLQGLRDTLTTILNEVEVVVDDFGDMLARLEDSIATINSCECIERELRNEAVEFLHWLQRNRMAFLGYEYLKVEWSGQDFSTSVDKPRSLGLLRQRNSAGVYDLTADIDNRSAEELRRKQLSFSKSRIRSRVHRLAYPDYVEVKDYDSDGNIVGQHRFLGLYTSTVYTMSPTLIPILRRKVERLIEKSTLDNTEHEGRELVRVLELFPREELFQSSVQDLFDTVTAVNQIQERRQTRLFVRKDVHGKFFNCLVYIPRDAYTTELRIEIQNILCTVLGAEESEFTTHFSESILVRVHFVLRVNPTVEVNYEHEELEEQIVQATLSWEDRLRNRLIEEFGEEKGEDLTASLGRGFPPGYRDDFDPRVAVLDIKSIQRLVGDNELEMNLYRLLEEGDNLLRLRLYHRGESLPLSDVLPILENLGLRVVTERPYEVRSADGDHFFIQEFSLIYALSHDIDLEKVRDEFSDAFSRIWSGEAESDSFNRLLIGTRLSWREIALLRAYSRYLRQVQFPYSIDYIAETMANHLHISAGIVELFLTRFSPVFDGDDDWRTLREEVVEQKILDSLDDVQNLGEDRIIRQMVAVIKATQRTNFFQEGMSGELKSYFSFKMCPGEIPDMPKPVPMFEIFVYSPRVEGVHLRGGKVARGGLRWSDRAEDFRTEVLGLVKAQQVKNAVIVPVGAKGGFIPRRITPEMSRDEVQQEGIECYKIFIRGLLDITDNRTETGIVGPPQVVVKDEEDPYLVVAADKGTATFSDIANSLSSEYNFWLGDAFASGGSVGYDHKKMAITARGAWVSVQRLFREFDVDIQETDFTVVGIGDMAGDVFGNGMLLSQHIKLVAAFNHMHIFIDPSPDATSSFAERKRLFEMPRSSWADYEKDLISAGGGVFQRSAKSITISPEMKECFDIEADHLTPSSLISHVLKARVDLLWHGGIGTYVKSSSESHMDVGDKANDAVRLNASELRCKVIGEGGNLGMTQLARVEFGLNGGRSNTDFIDNVGGVDCSDHEVNIKILLNAVVARGDLTEKHRNKLLEEMTDSIAELVLQNNYRQVQAISLAEFQAEERNGEYRRFISTLESSGRLDRDLEFIPSDEVLADRKVHGKGLTRPELSILVSYSKALLKEELIDSDLGKDAYMAGAVNTAFPARMVDEYGQEIQDHRLHKEIMATQIANDIVNRMGLTFVSRQQKATGAQVVDVARAYVTVMEVYSVARVWDEIEALDHKVSATVQTEMMLHLIRLVKRSVRWMLRNRRHNLFPSKIISEFGDALGQLREALATMVGARATEKYKALCKRYILAGVPRALAETVSTAEQAYTGLGIIQASTEAESPLLEVAELYFKMGEQLELDWFSSLIVSAKVENEWQALARDTYMEDLEWQQRKLATGALRHVCEKRDMSLCMERWQSDEETLITRWKQMLSDLHSTDAPDFAMFAVANRELLDLAQSSMYD
ncbi:MAG: NAD-glutamate dehydrogenase [Gammaproteobacteria bacterium]|nr:MAG: NAD-glutamate dehydrogenase [Gammaproteobacteria bacterium]